MLDLAKITFGEQSYDGVLLTLSSAADIQIKEKNKPIGFIFRYPVHL